jgi:hypothetical protein
MSTALAILPRIWACASPQKTVKPSPKPKPTPPVEPRLAFYRKYTEGMLRRYMRFSMEAGRVPSMLGQERLDRLQQLLITRIAVQEYTQGETAAMLEVSLRTVIRRYNKAIDRLTAIFLEKKMLEPRTECQEGKSSR